METQDHASTQPQPEGQGGRGRLFRSREDRVIAGVCGGLGRYFGLDPVVFRIAAVVVALLGGFGALAYLAAALLIPSEAGGEAPASGRDSGRTVAIVLLVLLLLVGWPLILGGGLLAAGLLVPLAVLALVGLLVWWLVSGEGPAGSGRDVARRSALGVAVLLVCAVVFFGGGFAAAVGGGAVVAGLVIAAGAMLVAGAFVGGIRWLILPALSLALAVGLVSAADLDLDGGVGERDYRPGSAAQLRDRYELGIGELVVDLRDANLPRGDTPLELDLGMGEANVIVPGDVCVATTAEIGMGEVDVFDRHNEGVDLDWEDQPGAEGGARRLVVDAQIGMGAFYVGHERTRDRFGHRHHLDDDGSDEAGNTACAERADAGRENGGALR